MIFVLCELDAKFVMPHQKTSDGCNHKITDDLIVDSILLDWWSVKAPDYSRLKMLLVVRVYGTLVLLLRVFMFFSGYHQSL